MDDSILAVVDRSIGQLPDDLPKDDISKVRMELFKQLRKAARKAARANGLILYLPTERVHDTVIPASFVVTEPTPVTGDVGSGIQTDHIFAALAADSGISEAVDVDGSSGIRMERVVPPQEGSEIPFSSRRVEYVLSVPGRPLPRWLAITFSTVGDGKPDSDYSSALVELFDAMMMTFRWSYE
ncbi:hypothetical protein ACIQ8D_00225 [Streptomyces sp. NPDC096094]|uniref:hypothetical protein n=1 Tax=Streptomyces sp. NPDC096094 TaxID=3366073 RepID=UPI0037F6250D